MVTNGIITLLYTIGEWIISLFPPFSGLPTEITDAATYIGGKAAGLSCIEPIDTWRAALVIVFTIAAVLAVIRFGSWLVGRKMRHPDEGKSA